VNRFFNSTFRLNNAIHINTRWKIQDRRQIIDTDDTETKRNPEKHKTQQNKTSLV